MAIRVVDRGLLNGLALDGEILLCYCKMQVGAALAPVNQRTLLPEVISGFVRLGRNGKGFRMNSSSMALMSAVAFLASVIANECSADSTATQLQQQELGIVDPAKPSDDDLAMQPPGLLNEILLRYDHLNRHFQLMDLPDAEDQLQQSLKRLQGNPQTVEDVVTLYKQLTDLSGKDNEFYGEARWRALYLLGGYRILGRRACCSK